MGVQPRSESATPASPSRVLGNSLKDRLSACSQERNRDVRAGFCWEVILACRYVGVTRMTNKQTSTERTTNLVHANTC